MALKLVFMGTPAFSVPVLEALVANGHDLAAVYTQPPRPAGRGMSEQKSPVHKAAEAHGIPVHTPKSLKGKSEQQAFAAHNADAAIVVAYGLILPRAVLDAPKHGCFNLHASALPRWRGAAPIQRAIMAGDKETAAMVMRMEEGLDTGPVCLADVVPITPETTAGDLHDTLAQKGAAVMINALRALEAGALQCTPQLEDGVTYAAKIEKSEARIDFSRSADKVLHQIHGLSPFPGAWFEIVTDQGRVERIKILRAAPATGHGTAGEVIDEKLAIACGKGAIRIVEAQRAGKKPMAADQLLRGFRLPKGTSVKNDT